MVKVMQNKRCYDLTSLNSEFKTVFCNDFGYTLDYRNIKTFDEPNFYKTCCNHKKKVNKKVNSKK